MMAWRRAHLRLGMLGALIALFVVVEPALAGGRGGGGRGGGGSGPGVRGTGGGAAVQGRPGPRGGGHHGFHGHKGFHSSVVAIGPSFGWGPWWSGPGWWWDPWPSPWPWYGSGVRPERAVTSPPVYLERPEGSWYYCPSARAYYPDVPACPDVWIPVSPRTE
jgi:hypothetical protein